MPATIELAAGIAGAAIGVLGYIPYLTGVARGTVAPNWISWLVWSLLGVVSLSGQIEGGAGLGAAVTAVTTAGCALIVVLGVKVSGIRNSCRVLPRIDWACLAGALLALTLLLTMNDPLIAVLLSNLIGLIGFIPTVRKVLQEPNGEGISVYAFAGTKFLLALVAVHEWSMQTWLYPALCTLEEIAMVTIILTARCQDRKTQTDPNPPQAPQEGHPGTWTAQQESGHALDRATEQSKIQDTAATITIVDAVCSRCPARAKVTWNQAAETDLSDDIQTPEGWLLHPNDGAMTAWCNDCCCGDCSGWPEGILEERTPTMGEITMEAYIADMRDEVDAAVAEGLLEITPAKPIARASTIITATKKG